MMEPRFFYPDGAWELLNNVKSHCEVCAACNPANYSLAGNQHPTPIRYGPMASLGMDAFSMPDVLVAKDTYDCILIVVDRHPGYLFAVRPRKRV